MAVNRELSTYKWEYGGGTVRGQKDWEAKKKLDVGFLKLTGA